MAEETRHATHRNPYPGLRPFRADEEHLFFGREHQVDRMVDKLAAHRFLAVVGGSGSGKSSLVNCGLRPALHRGYMASAGSAWRIAQFRPGNDPIGALARVLAAPGVLFDTPGSGALPAETLVGSTLRLGSLGLVDIVDQADLPEGTQLLVVADQFEELFRFRALIHGARPEGWSPAEDAVAFVRLLLEAVEQTAHPIHVVLTMRSDFLGDCAQFLGLPEAINDGQYLVPRMTRDEIRAAITGPAQVRGASISPVLVTRLLNDVGDNPDQLSILQHALNRTWAAWEAEAAPQAPIDLRHYESIGGMARALDQHAERAYAEVGDVARQRQCESVFKALTDTGTDPRGTRRPLTLATLIRITGATADELMAVLEVFRKPSRSFLMPPLPERLQPDHVIDISHESLMRVWKRLRNWADEEAQSAHSYRHLRETAAQFEQGRQSLLRDPELQVLLDWQAKNRPCSAWADLYGGGFDGAKAFLDCSLAARTEEHIEAETERRWAARERFVPIAVAVVVFVALQAWLADMLGAALAGFDLFRPSWSGRLSQVLAHVLAGTPAALAYLGLGEYLSPVLRRRVRARVLAEMAQQREMAAAAPPDFPRADIGALGYASFMRRAAAQLVDWLICAPIASVLGSLWFAFDVATTPESGTSAAAAAASAAGAAPPLPGEGFAGTAMVVSWFVLFWLYHVRAWTSERQATWGMRLAGVQVTDLQGSRLGWRRATGRFLARILSYYTLGIGFLVQPFSAKRQALHDRLSGTLVLNRSPRPKA